MNSDDTVEEPLKRVSLFGERLSKDEYFTGAGHLNILVNMRRDIAARIPLLVLTGEEGCGKSVLGRMVAAEARSGCLPVYLDTTVDSFEDLVSQIAARLDIEVSGLGRDTIAASVEQIAASLARNNERLLVICDGAERIFLATLERLRKMMDRLNRAVVSMQVILIGRPLLLDNLQQLAICDFEEIPEKRYVLEPLTFAETRSYLEFCKQKMPEAESAIFTADTVDRLYQESGGNFKEIHLLAEQFCNRYNRDASFWVLLENVEGAPIPAPVRPAPSRKKRQSRPSLDRFDPRKLSRRQQLIGGGAVFLLLSLLLAMPDSKVPVEPEATPVAQSSSPAALPAPEQAEAPPAEPEIPEKSGETVTPPAETTQPAAPAEQLAVNPPAEEQALDSPPEEPQQPEVVEPPQEESLGALESVPEPAAETPAAAPPVVEEQPEPANPAKEQLQQAEALLAEAQQAVQTAKTDTGKELVAAATPGQPEAAAPADIPMLSPDRQKKKIEPETVGALPPASAEQPSLSEMPVSAAQVPVLTVDKVKQKKLATDPTGAAAVGQPVAALRQAARPEDAGTKKIPVLGKAIVSGQQATVAVYPERVAAGVPWLDGKKDDKYTMQLMVLSSQAAREGVKAMLTRSEYAGDADSFYIFEKRSGAPAVFVFMGEYDSLTEAEEARKSMPTALQKHKPYVLSVPEAIQKVQ